MKELKYWQQQVLQEYLKNGENGTEAYAKIKPNCKSRTYLHNASCKLVNSDAFQTALAEAKRAVTVSTDVTKQSLLRDAARITQKAEEKEHFSAALKGNELQGRYIGAFDSEEESADMYSRLIQKISVKNLTINNTQINNEREMKVVGES